MAFNPKPDRPAMIEKRKPGFLFLDDKDPVLKEVDN